MPQFTSALGISEALTPVTPTFVRDAGDDLCCGCVGTPRLTVQVQGQGSSAGAKGPSDGLGRAGGGASPAEFFPGGCLPACS